MSQGDSGAFWITSEVSEGVRDVSSIDVLMQGSMTIEFISRVTRGNLK